MPTLSADILAHLWHSYTWGGGGCRSQRADFSEFTAELPQQSARFWDVTPCLWWGATKSLLLLDIYFHCAETIMLLKKKWTTKLCLTQKYLTNPRIDLQLNLQKTIAGHTFLNSCVRRRLVLKWSWLWPVLHSDTSCAGGGTATEGGPVCKASRPWLLVTAPLGMWGQRGQTGKVAAFDLYLLRVCFAFTSRAEGIGYTLNGSGAIHCLKRPRIFFQSWGDPQVLFAEWSLPVALISFDEKPLLCNNT